jgi:integrase
MTPRFGATVASLVRRITRFPVRILFRGKGVGRRLRVSGVFARTRKLQTGRSGIRTVQELLGLRDVTTTQVYTHVLHRGPAGVLSPADRILGS